MSPIAKTFGRPGTDRSGPTSTRPARSVGAPSIAANGDVANKIGTYTVAVLAARHGVPFYVAAPLSTIDLGTPTGNEIPIEERSGDEVTHIFGADVAPEEAPAANFAFDVTPHELITAIITEEGVLEPPYYFKPGWELEGRTVLEALMEQRMVRRGDDIYQYGTVRFTEHGGALYGGEEHEGGEYDRLTIRTRQGEEMRLHLGEGGACDGCFQVGDRVRARLQGRVEEGAQQGAQPDRSHLLDLTVLHQKDLGGRGADVDEERGALAVEGRCQRERVEERRGVEVE